MNKQEYYKKQREIAFNRDFYCCQICGKSASQTAHIIPKYKYMIEKYGLEIINHHSNLKSACSLACNKKLEIKIKGGEEEKKQIRYIIGEINKE